MSSKSDVPKLSWGQIEKGKVFFSDNDFVLFTGFLLMPNTQRRVPVCYKVVKMSVLETTDEMLHEARVLLQLRDINGVPRLFGVTESPVALVTSRSAGEVLKNLQQQSSARSYLAALRETCILLGKLHRRGIVHCNISAYNILVVTRRIKDDVTVSLVGFESAEMTKDRVTRQTDTDSVVFLMHEMAKRVGKNSWLYRHLDKLRVQREINLTGIVRVLCSILHGGPEKCPKCSHLRPGY